MVQSKRLLFLSAVQKKGEDYLQCCVQQKGWGPGFDKRELGAALRAGAKNTHFIIFIIIL